MCTCGGLVKPTQRLQHLLHSASSSSGLSRNSQEDLTEQAPPATSLEEAQEQLAELQLLVALLPQNLRGPLLIRPDLPQVLAKVACSTT